MGFLISVGRHLCVLLLLCLFLSPADAQVLAGMAANGKVVGRGDTVHVCQGGSIKFQSVAQGSTNIDWRFGGGSIGVASGIGPFFVNYTAVGYDTVWQVIKGGNYSDSMYCIVQVSDKRPASAFKWSPDGDCGNTPIQFDNLSTGDKLSYSWDFNDGSTSNETAPSHAFLNAIGVSGTSSYTVGLLVTNPEGCSNVVTHTITVKNTADASLGNADQDVQFGTFNGNSTFKKCSNIPSYTFKFTNKSTTMSINTGYTIQWGDGSPDSSFISWPSGVVIAHTFPLGSSSMTLKVSGKNGCTGIHSYTIFLGSTPAGGLSSLGNTDVCASDSLRFAINNISANPPGTLYTLLINDGSPAEVFGHPPPSIVGHYFAAGSCGYISSSGNSFFNNAFGAYLTIENPCGTTSPSVVPIYVSGKPRANIYAYPANTACVNSPLRLQSASTFGSVITSTGGTSSICSNSGKQVWVVTPSTGYSIVTGNPGSLNGHVADGSGWTPGTDELNMIFTRTGTYTVKLYVYNNRCGMDSTVEQICVRNPPQASFRMPANFRCEPGTLLLTNTSPIGSCGGDAYFWQVDHLDPLGCAGTVTAPATFSSENSYSTQLTVKAPGKYAIRLTVTALNAGISCSPAVYTDTLTVAGTPKIDLSLTGSICAGSSYIPTARIDSCYSPGPFSYNWQFTGGQPAGSTLAVPAPVTYANTGNYPVSLTVTDTRCNKMASASGTIPIVPPPTAFAGRDTALCSGGFVALGRAPVAGVTYRWMPGRGLSDSTIANPILQATASTDTVVAYTLQASFGLSCSNTATVNITIHHRPNVAVSPAAPAICAGASIQLTAAGANSYTWSPAASTASITIQPDNSSNYTVIGMSADGCADTLQVPVIVRPNAKASMTASSTMICRNADLQSLLTLTPFPEGNSDYKWYDNGSPIGTGAGTAAVPSWSPSGAGRIDTIELVTASLYNCKSDSVSIIFQSRETVAAHFIKDQAAGCGPLTVRFTNNSTPAVNGQFFWDFGNGQRSTDTQPAPVVFNNNDSLYVITLKAYNGCDTTLWRDTVIVYPHPHAAFTVANVLGCSPFPETFTNVSKGNNTSYHWDFGDGAAETVQSMSGLVHTYHTGVIDTFTVTLNATNRCGTHSDSLDIVVTPSNIRPGITASGNALFGCAPFNASFVNNSDGAAQIAVDFNDGSSIAFLSGSQPLITHQFQQAGTYNISMRLTNACVDTTVYRSVTVYAAPTPAFNVSANPICTGGTVTALSQSRNANSYLWEWGDSTSSNGVNSQHVFPAAGSYPVRLTASFVNNYGTVCRVTSDPLIVKVVDIIPARIDTGSTKPCAPYNLTVIAHDVSDARSVEWSFADANVIGASASYQYNMPGDYKVRLVVQNAGGCTDTAYHSFHVSPTPKLTARTFGTLYTCNTDTALSLSATVTYAGGDQLAYTWDINEAGAMTGNPFEYRFTLPAGPTSESSFAIRSKVTNTAGCSDTLTAGTLVIRPLPKPQIAVEPDSIIYQPDYTFGFSNTVQFVPGIRYSWDLGDMNGGSTQSFVTHKYGDTGAYMVKLRVSDNVTGCSKSDTMRVRIMHIPGFLYVPDAICPGCAVGELRTFMPKGKGLRDYRLRIYSSWGQLLFETTKLNADGAPAEAWDARWNGQTVSQDAYRWQIEARYINGTEWRGMLYPGKSTPVKSGFITVVR